jgi:hypothetical protein
VTVQREALTVILLIVDIGLAHSDVDALADLEDAIAHTSVLPWQMRLPRTAWVRTRAQLRRATPTIHPAGIARFLSSQIRALAEDKRFELLRVSPTRFPSLLLAVQRRSGMSVTWYYETGRTLPAAAERPRMRRKLRRTAVPAWAPAGNILSRQD